MKIVVVILALWVQFLCAQGSIGYSQNWLKGDENTDAQGGAHVHEGLRLQDSSGWVGIGETNILGVGDKTTRVLVKKIDNDGTTVWSREIGDSHKTANKRAYSTGFSIYEDSGFLYIGVGLWQKSDSTQKAAVLALDATTGNIQWTTFLNSQPRHGGVRGLIIDGDKIVCTGYVDCPQPGFLFVADDSKPAVWQLSKSGNLSKENILSIEGLGQGAKIRKDLNSGYIMTSTAWTDVGGSEVNAVALVKLSDNLDVEWDPAAEMYAMAGGNSQVFDMLVDLDGNYLMGGHTTVGTNVVNWDYLALKVDSTSKQVMWRKTFGQPRNFDPRYIHDEMYGVKLDQAGNYLLLGGSGDEYSYTATDSTTGWMSDEWVSYLVVLNPQGEKLYENFYGAQGANNAGEYLAVDPNSGDVMIFVDSDTLGGAFGFLKLTPDNSSPTQTPPGPPSTTTKSTTTTKKSTTTTKKSTTQPPTQPPCKDIGSKTFCKKRQKRCNKNFVVAKKCKKTCSGKFVNIWSWKKCKNLMNKKKCGKKNVAKKCKKTCMKCNA